MNNQSAIENYLTRYVPWSKMIKQAPLVGITDANSLNTKELTTRYASALSKKGYCIHKSGKLLEPEQCVMDKRGRSSYIAQESDLFNDDNTSSYVPFEMQYPMSREEELTYEAEANIMRGDIRGLSRKVEQILQEAENMNVGIRTLRYLVMVARQSNQADAAEYLKGRLRSLTA